MGLATDSSSFDRHSRLASLLGAVFLVTLCFPGLFGLPGGASLGLAAMMASLPIWYETARSRLSPFDSVGQTATIIILSNCGFLIFWSLLSTFGTDLPLRAARYLATQVSAFAIYFLVRGTVTYPRLRRYLDVVAITLAVTCALSIVGYSVRPLGELIFRETDRAAGLFKNPNQFGMAIATVFPSIAALALGDHRRRALRVICLILLLLGLVASGSKTNLLISMTSLVFVLCAHSVVSYSGPRRIFMIALNLMLSIGVAALGIAALALMNPRALAILTVFLNSEGEVDSLVARSLLWKTSFDLFLANPWLGVGAGQNIEELFWATKLDVPHSHNVLIDYLRSLGAPGGVGIAIILITVIIVSFASIRAALLADASDSSRRMICLGLSLSCLAYIAANMSSDSMGPSTSPFFWVVVFLSFAARKLLYPDRSVKRTGELPPWAN